MTLLALSCGVAGPRSISRDQFHYGASIADAAREQILSNIVGLRYGEAPTFLNVSSVINQYVLEGEVAAGIGFNTAITGKDTVTLGGAGRWSDRPTITYAPVTGRDFAASLLTPLPPESLFALVQAGWPAEGILRMTVASINGVRNERASPAQRRQADARFIELLRAWGRLRNAGVLGLRREAGEGGAQIIMHLDAEGQSEDIARDVSLFHETLGLDPSVREARLGYGLIPDAPNKIAVLTSSILEVLNEMAWRAEVPPVHVDEGRTLPTFVTEVEGLEPLIHIHQADERPDDAFVAVETRGSWFYVDDRDTRSKRTLAFVQILLSLTDSSTTARGPVVSLSN